MKAVQHFTDLFRKMLMVDCNWRITPLEVLQHPFFSLEQHTDSSLNMTIDNLTVNMAEMNVIQSVAPGEETVFTTLEDGAALIQPG